MARLRSVVLRPWIRELVLGLERLSSPRAGQLLQVLQEAEAEAPGPSCAPDTSDVGAALLVSDGTHSVRCLVTRETLDAADWEEKEFGFRGAEGRLLLLQDCEVRVQVAEGSAPAEFYLQVHRFSLMPTEQPRDWVIGCNQDPDVQKKLKDCLEEHLSESASSNAGLSLTQLLEEVQEEEAHQGALVRLAESCLMLSGPCTAPPLTRWATSSHLAMDPPKKHRDGSAFQYKYAPPCTSLCAQVQAARLPPQLLAWALHFLMEPQPESEQTQV
ncbi:Adrenocortical dysplasia protein like protein [Myotis davidii]|uniref:Adrenocortical dysplasia protein like protein n=1 Tax=Myotis davidii TaxID=225400 RepID=L5LHD1_MYODS|nr:Adrenocortical dysplasia protein like protein [Myotis davidii]